MVSATARALPSGLPHKRPSPPRGAMVDLARMAVPDLTVLRVFAAIAHRRWPAVRMVDVRVLIRASSQLVSDIACTSDVVSATSRRYPLPAPGAARLFVLW